MLVSLKKYIVDVYYKYYTKIDYIDSDFWDEVYLIDLEEVQNV